MLIRYFQLFSHYKHKNRTINALCLNVQMQLFDKVMQENPNLLLNKIKIAYNQMNFPTD